MIKIIIECVWVQLVAASRGWLGWGLGMGAWGGGMVAWGGEAHHTTNYPAINRLLLLHAFCKIYGLPMLYKGVDNRLELANRMLLASS